jgi:hypothetical protein
VSSTSRSPWITHLCGSVTYATLPARITQATPLSQAGLGLATRTRSSYQAMEGSAVPQLKPGHKPPAAPPRPPPHREGSNELEPAPAFRITAGGT